MLYLVTLISLALAQNCADVKDEEFVPHCGKCMYDQQCIGWQHWKAAANAVGRANFVYCCPNIKRCLQADPENPNDYRYELMRCPSGAGFPEGDEGESAECQAKMTGDSVKQSNWRGNRDTPGCSERSKDYPAGCQCETTDWPNNWVSGCEGGAVPQETEAPKTEETEAPKVEETTQVPAKGMPCDKCATAFASEGGCPLWKGGADPKEIMAKVPEDCDPEKCFATMMKVCKEEPEEMSCDECTSKFVSDGGCPLWKSGAGKEALMAKIPEGCDPEKCSESMMAQCSECDTCATSFGAAGGCEASMRDDVTEEDMNAMLPKGCSGELCMHSIGDFCMNNSGCDDCAAQFAANGGCGPALRGEDPSEYVPKGCNPNVCGPQLKEACMANMPEESSDAGEMEMICPEASCECKSYQKEIYTEDEDGCEVCECLTKCACKKGARCSKGKLPMCTVARNSRCADKEKKKKKRRVTYRSALACMSDEEQLEWHNSMAFAQAEEPAQFTVEDFAVYGFAAIGVAAIAYSAFTKLSGARKYVLVEEYGSGEL